VVGGFVDGRGRAENAARLDCALGQAADVSALPGVVEGDAVGVADAGTAEEVEGAADGEVDAALADPFDGFEVLERAGPTGVGGGEWGPDGEFLDEGLVDAVAEAFDVDCVDEELGTGLREAGECFRAEADVGELLPTVGDDPVGAVTESATEVEHEAVATDQPGEFVDALPVNDAVAEDPGSDDHVGGAGVEPIAGIGGLDAAAVLESAGPCAEGFAGGGLVSWAEGDDVAASEAILPIARGEPGRRLGGFEVGADAGAGVGEGAPHDLDDAASAEVDARSEHGADASEGGHVGATGTLPPLFSGCGKMPRFGRGRAGLGSTGWD